MKQSTMKPQAAIREEELKNRIAALFFGKYDCTRIVGNMAAGWRDRLGFTAFARRRA